MVAEVRFHDRSAVDLALLLGRVIVGVVFMAHGAQKLFGAFGGPGLSAFVGMMGPLGYLQDLFIYRECIVIQKK